MHFGMSSLCWAVYNSQQNAYDISSMKTHIDPFIQLFPPSTQRTTEQSLIPTVYSSNNTQLKDLKQNIQSPETCKSLVICSERNRGSACHLKYIRLSLAR